MHSLPARHPQGRSFSPKIAGSVCGKALGAGLFELRIDTGPGYRVYCGQDGATLVLLLCAGDKRTQTKDIEHARDYWQDYQGRR